MVAKLMACVSGFILLSRLHDNDLLVVLIVYTSFNYINMVIRAFFRGVLKPQTRSRANQTPWKTTLIKTDFWGNCRWMYVRHAMNLFWFISFVLSHIYYAKSLSYTMLYALWMKKANIHALDGYTNGHGTQPRTTQIVRVPGCDTFQGRFLLMLIPKHQETILRSQQKISIIFNYLIWLVVWNICFPNSWDDDPIWFPIFSEGLKPPTSNYQDSSRNHRKSSEWCGISWDIDLFYPAIQVGAAASPRLETEEPAAPAEARTGQIWDHLGIFPAKPPLRGALFQTFGYSKVENQDANFVGQSSFIYILYIYIFKKGHGFHLVKSPEAKSEWSLQWQAVVNPTPHGSWIISKQCKPQHGPKCV